MKGKSWYQRMMPAIQFMKTVMLTTIMDSFSLSPSIYIELKKVPAKYG